jgi:hypothetical protein
MKLRFLAACLFAVLVASASTFAIGRSGNGSGSSLVSESLGFTANAPRTFPDTTPLDGEALRLRFPGVEFLNGVMVQPFIEVSPVAKFFPELHELSRGEVEAHFNLISWDKLREQGCLDLYHQPGSQVFVAIWGREKGISVIGPVSPNVKVGIEEILSTLELSSGACSW